MLTLEAPTLEERNRPGRGSWRRLLGTLALVALVAASFAMGWTSRGGRDTADPDPLEGYTATAGDLRALQVYLNMPEGTFEGAASSVDIRKDGQLVGSLATMTLTRPTKWGLDWGETDLDQFLAQALRAAYGKQPADEASGLVESWVTWPIIGSTRLAEARGFGVSAAWVQNDNLMVFDGALWGGATEADLDEFLRDYLSSSRQIPVPR